MQGSCSVQSPERTPGFGVNAQQIARILDELALEPGARVLVGAGDIARCDALSPALATADLVEAVVGAASDALVITLGDHAYERGSQSEFEQCYEPSWGRFEAITRPSPGNHDYQTADAAPYFQYFSHYDRNPAAAARGYYSFEFAGWHVVALNSMLEMDAGSAQLEWLEDDLRNANADCVLAYWHHPLFSSSLRSVLPWYQGRQARDVWDVLGNFDADVVVNGHEHFYERYLPQNAAGEAVAGGLPQFTVGTGGGELQSAPRARDHRAFVYTEGYGIFVLILAPEEYQWAFLGTDGAIHDRSMEPVSCHDLTLTQ